ncbi:MAG: PEP-CTERM sorting domain-containing protein [Rubrivivax sp.]
MSLSLRPLVLGTALALAFGSAQAVFIVDTGPGSTPSWSLGPTQSLAAAFDLRESMTIDSIEGWIEAFFVATARIELIDGDSPTGKVLHTAQTVPSSGNGSAWEGAFGLGWTLPAGSYTVAFHGVGNNTFAMQGGAPRPLGAEWFQRGDGANWNRFDGLNIGVRVAAAPIPEPASVALWALGLGVLVSVSARRRSSAR